MFTIKHIFDHREALVQGSEVNHVSATTVMYLDGNEWQSLTGGTVYVMNDSGKTVAHYALEGDEGEGISQKADRLLKASMANPQNWASI